MEALMQVVEKERQVMEESGGGVTMCGGEPLMHVDYLCEVLEELGRRKIHRTVDTTLFASAETVKRVAERCELFLVDIKHMDSATHQKYTGVPNEPILENLKMIAQMECDFFIRIPLIEGVNADESNIEATAVFLATLPWQRKTVNLLPYHDIGKGKHEKLGTTYNPNHIDMSTPTDEVQQRCIDMFKQHGITAIIGG